MRHLRCISYFQSALLSHAWRLCLCNVDRTSALRASHVFLLASPLWKVQIYILQTSQSSTYSISYYLTRHGKPSFWWVEGIFSRWQSSLARYYLSFLSPSMRNRVSLMLSSLSIDQDFTSRRLVLAPSTEVVRQFYVIYRSQNTTNFKQDTNIASRTVNLVKLTGKGQVWTMLTEWHNRTANFSACKQFTV